MKIAICITGALKAYSKTYESINNNLIVPNNADVYVSTWDVLGVDLNHLKIPKDTVKITNREVTKEDVFKFTNVKGYDIHHFDEEFYVSLGDIKIPPDVKEANPKHYYSTIPVAFRNIKCGSFNLNRYDLIVKIRPDIKFKSKFLITPKRFDPNSLHSCSYNINTNTQVSDKFVLGGYNVIMYYFSFLNNLNIYWKEVNLVGERLLKYHMSKSKFQTKYFRAPVKIIRENLK